MKEVAGRGPSGGRASLPGRGCMAGRGGKRSSGLCGEDAGGRGPPPAGARRPCLHPDSGAGPSAETGGPELWLGRLHRASHPLPLGCTRVPDLAPRFRPPVSVPHPPAHLPTFARPLADGSLGRCDRRCGLGRVGGRVRETRLRECLVNPSRYLDSGLDRDRVESHAHAPESGAREETSQRQRHGTLRRRSDWLCCVAAGRPANLSGPVPWLCRVVGAASTSRGRRELSAEGALLSGTIRMIS